MAQKLPDWLKFPLVLVIVAAISAASLAGLWSLTAKSRRSIADKDTEAALSVVFPGADQFEVKETKVEGKPFTYRVAIKDGGITGYVAEGAAVGYSSTIRVMVGVNTDFSIAGIKVLSQKETPGLGDKILEKLSKKTWGTIITGTSPNEKDLRPWFQVQFDGRKVPIKVNKDGGEIEAITGATISSRAVCQAVNEAVENVKKAVAS
jgi:electron transport complex protein RnfG